MKTERSDFGKTKVLLPTESNVKIEQLIYFKYKNILHNISKLSSGAVRSKFNICVWLPWAWRTASMRFWQGFIQCIDEVIRNSKESSLACLPEFIKILWFRLPCFLFHPTPDMLNDVHDLPTGLAQDPGKHLDLLRSRRVAGSIPRDGSMRWSTTCCKMTDP